jgi:hypothetical protein
MITIEEAHRFLDPATAKQTIFGTIAREMRKYFVTLLVVDQRPSGIDNEVMSQIGTRITALLNDEKDIDAIFTGVSGARVCGRCWPSSILNNRPWCWAMRFPCPLWYAPAPTTAPSMPRWAHTPWEDMPDDIVFKASEAAKADLGF